MIENESEPLAKKAISISYEKTMIYLRTAYGEMSEIERGVEREKIEREVSRNEKIMNSTDIEAAELIALETENRESRARLDLLSKESLNEKKTAADLVAYEKTDLMVARENYETRIAKVNSLRSQEFELSDKKMRLE